VRTSISLLLYSYTLVALSVIEFVQCVRVGPSNVVEQLPAINCDSRAYTTWRGIAILLIATTVACLPIALILFVFVNRRRIQRKDGTNTGTVDPREDQGDGHGELKADRVFGARFSVLYDMFQPKYAFWNSVVLIRRVSLVGAVVIDDPLIRFSILSWLNFTYAYLHMMVQPFVLPVANALESLSLAILSVISVLHLAWPTLAQVEASSSIQTAISCLVLIPLGIMFCTVVIVRMKVAMKAMSITLVAVAPQPNLLPHSASPNTPTYAPLTPPPSTPTPTSSRPAFNGFDRPNGLNSGAASVVGVEIALSRVPSN